MKITIVLLSILAASATWWWNMRSHHIRTPGFAQKLKNILKCLITGAVVYFVLMACTLAYLMITTP